MVLGECYVPLHRRENKIENRIEKVLYTLVLSIYSVFSGLSTEHGLYFIKLKW